LNLRRQRAAIDMGVELWPIIVADRQQQRMDVAGRR
jgi:hypothetical protein